MSRARLALVAIAAALAIGVVVLAARTAEDAAPCGAGFTRTGPRCCAAPLRAPGVCASRAGDTCPAPLEATARGCDAPERDVVEVPPTKVVVGPSDWEAEGRVAPRAVEVGRFAIDRFEVSVGRACAHPAMTGAAWCDAADAARAASGVGLAAARDFCASCGGRLPTEDEWLAAAGGDRPRRYPWGDTGAVCRRAAWGLEAGPCAEGAAGPDTVGAHPEGATPLGIHDLAGNVAEWVEPACPEPGRPCPRVVRGGSWKTRLATELRTWLRREVGADAERGGDPTIGFRCAYDRVP
ncbi:MAG: SUMF1/EgtB/PvdO family nonheme iron enzyme [Labilithrix sp.]|nr:SUMF1/EgtB/PvdO family nonheme iron enzyme [Labilithrix sp.]MBX3217646.1 SUMF1/EgtB/PvdO family nonheme iron enzyme [Labilithrix sp.]